MNFFKEDIITSSQLIHVKSEYKNPSFDYDSDDHSVTMDTIRRQQTLDQDWYDSIGTY